MSLIRQLLFLFALALLVLVILGQTAAAQSREIRAVDTTFTRGIDNTVSIVLAAQGNEVGAQFSVIFDPTILSNPRATLGSGAPSGSLLTNASKVSEGKLGIILSLPITSPPTTFAAGTDELVQITFTTAAAIGETTTQVGFGPVPLAQEVSDASANPLPTTYAAGTMTLTGGNNPVPTLTDIDPASTIAGGPAFSLTVNGTNFIGTSVVEWNGSARTTHYVSGTQVTADITAGDIASGGTANVTVVSPAPGGGTSNAQTFTTNNPTPTTTSISPTTKNAGDAAFTLTVNGTNFVPSSVVQWGGAARTTTFVNSSQLTASIPATDLVTAGNIAVTVMNPAPGGGTTNAQTLAVNNPSPTITSLSPTSILAGSAAFTLTVNGTGFVNASQVQWNGSNRTTTYVSGTQLQASIPATDVAAEGTATVTVVNAAPGGGTSNGQSFSISVNPVPTITTLSPTSKTVGDGAFSLTVNGTNFVNNSSVQWNGVGRTTHFVSSTQVTADISASDLTAAGTVNVTVFNPAPGGGTSGAATFTINNPLPTTTSLSPASALAGGAAFTLTVYGSNFVSTSVVQWGGAARTTHYVSATQLTADIPAADIAVAGNVSVTVHNPAPGEGTSNAQTFLINNPVPALTTINPSSAIAGGAAFTLTVNGTGFVGASVVRWNGLDRATTFVSGTQLTATITAADIAGSGTASVTVSNPTPGGGVSSARVFTINNPTPTTTSLSPSTALAGDVAFTLTVNGTNFVSNSTVEWNGAARATTYVSATQVTASIPATDVASAGTVNVTVLNPAPGGGASNAQTFTITNPAPTTTSISPTSILAGSSGFTLTVNGTGFVSTSVVQWNGAARLTTFVSSIQLRASILAADVAAEGTAAVTVMNPAPGGGTSNAQTFTMGVNPTPTTTSVSPSTVVAAGASFTLTVNGTNFLAASVVRWNGSARPTTYVSSTALLATINAADIVASGTASVTVFNPAPGGGESNAQTVTINNGTPGITSLNPTGALVGGAAFTLTVNGTGFVNGSVVQWNGSARTTTYVNSTQVTAAIPASDIASATTATITVFNPPPVGGTSGGVPFNVSGNNPVPTVASLAPSSAVLGGAAFSLTVNGTNFVSSSIVRWNGSDRVTTFVSATQLRAAILDSDLASVSSVSVTVFNPAPGGGTSGGVNFTIMNPVPTLSSINPNTRTAGGITFTLTVTGTSFVPTSVVQWNGATRPTAYLSNTQLTATIPSTDIADTGHASITVFTPSPGGGTSGSLDLTISERTCTFTIVPVAEAFTAAGGAGTVNVTTFTGCAWSASSHAAWITLPASSGGSGNGSVSYTVAANSSSSSRTGTLTVAGQTFTVTQGAASSTSQPDLVISELRASTSGVMGGQVDVYARVTNIGSGPANPFLLGFYFSTDAVIAPTDTDTGWNCDFSLGLASGASAECNGLIAVPTSLTPGTYYLGGIADKNNAIAELDEGNNTRTADTGTLTITNTPSTSTDFSLPEGGAETTETYASTGTLEAGYATVDEGMSKTGAFDVAVTSQIYGTAIFVLRQNGIVVSETPVPASPPTTATRIFIDYRTGVASKNNDQNAATLSFNTGIAAVNMGSSTATITYTLRDSMGRTLASGTGHLAARAHFAKFIDQLAEVTPNFNFPPDFGTAFGFGSLEIASDQPLSVLALRMTTNQRGENLYTSTPSADLTEGLSSATLIFPRLVDGGGWKTMLLLMNTSNMTEAGTLFINDGNGEPLSVRLLDGTTGTSFSYSIPPGGVYVLQTDGSPVDWNAGSVTLVPAPFSSAPVGAGVFGFTQSGVLVTESGVPSGTPTTHARIYVDKSWGHSTGLAIANPSDGNMTVNLISLKTDGATPEGSNQGPITIKPHGMIGTFVDTLISGLPPEFTGVLDISSSTPFVALAVRTLYNERNDFLISTFPIADFNQPAPAPIVFPQIADGNAGGVYQTQFILLSTRNGVTTHVRFYGDTGAALAVGKK